ncbi:hypothetical protein E4N82_09070 [Treponema denticola]|uniref:hypothetical protein n=1 Tax=Treponema denticola TaxID=158 RepID=UPI004037FD49
MTKKELIDAMKGLDDDAEISIYCESLDFDIGGYAVNICFENKVDGNDVMNELTIVAEF